MDNSKLKAGASDHLANERTFLAWIRTSIAMMGFGFVVVKFSLFVKQLSLAFAGHNIIPSKGVSGEVGMSLVAVGALTALIGYLRYRRIERQLLNMTFYPSSRLLLVLTVGVILCSLLLVYYLLPNLRSINRDERPVFSPKIIKHYENRGRFPGGR